MGCFGGVGGGVYARDAADVYYLGWVDDERVAERGEGEDEGEKEVGKVHFDRVNGFCAQKRKDKMKQDLVGAMWLQWPNFQQERNGLPRNAKLNVVQIDLEFWSSNCGNIVLALQQAMRMIAKISQYKTADGTN